MARIEKILREYGSVQAYRDHIEEIKRQQEEDMELFLAKERERKAQEEAEQKKKNAKNSLENKMRVARWMGNYDNKTKEII